VRVVRYSVAVVPSKLEINDSSPGSIEKSVGTANGLGADAIDVDVTAPVATPVVTVMVAGPVVVDPAVFAAVLNDIEQGKETVG